MFVLLLLTAVFTVTTVGVSAMGPKKNNKNNEQGGGNGGSKQTALEELQQKVLALEERVEKLESKNAILSKVTDVLRSEVDRLDQYGRRSNIIIRNVEVADGETQENVEQKVKDIVGSLNAGNAVKDIDKTHRIGKIHNHDNNKRYQNIVVRFRSHKSRYAVYAKRKSAKDNVKINPHLTNQRAKTLHESVDLVNEIDGVDFTFSNLHGDLCVRLKEPVNNKNVFNFKSIDDLKKLLGEKLNVEFEDDN